MTTPVARSYARSPSSTLIVLSNDERREPCSRRQFQPPSLLAREPRDDRRHVDAEVGAVGHRATVDALLDLALPERLAVMLPVRVGADQRDHPPRSLARWAQAELAQEIEHVGSRGPRLSLRLPRTL